MKRAGRPNLFSRNRKTFNARFPGIVAALQNLPDESIIDGEIVAMDESGRPSLNRLQNFAKIADAITFYAFDMLMWKGDNLQAQPLDRRRDLLRTKVMPKLPAIRLSESFAVTAAEMVSAVQSQGLEGIVAKRRDSRYEPGRRSGAWVKMRIGGGQEFVIGGYTPSPKNFDALLVGFYESGKLLFAASGSGFGTPRGRLCFAFQWSTDPLNVHSLICRRARGGGRGLAGAEMEKCIWLKPRLVAAIEYAEWTPANHLRHAKFIGLREDKKPSEVKRERPADEGRRTEEKSV